jgi:hypothetical protein
MAVQYQRLCAAWLYEREMTCEVLTGAVTNLRQSVIFTRNSQHVMGLSLQEAKHFLTLTWVRKRKIRIE